MAEDILAFQAGREAAMACKPRDGRRSADWLEGFDQVAGQRPASYSSRSNAVRAARAAAKAALGPFFCAYEGPDFEIHPDSAAIGYLGGERFYFRLRGPALAASEGRDPNA